MKVAINGFGRIGRVVLRAALDMGVLGEKFELVAINDPGGAQNAAQLLKYDSVHGKLEEELKVGKDWVSVDGVRIPIVSERDPLKLPWKEMGVETVLECTGVFRKRDEAAMHISAGAKKVLISAPAKDKVDATIIMGVNEQEYDRKKHSIISMASCTTNCLAPVVKLINDNFKVRDGFMTTIHAYTNDQRVLDTYHKDVRRARAAGVNIIPTSTGAAKAIGEVIPEMAGKMDGIALRVPVACGSITDMVFNVEKKVGVGEVNEVFKKAAKGKMKGILEYSEEPLVSTDVVGNAHSSIIDGELTKVIGNSVKVLAWYDNEWGYSCRMVDMVTKIL
ncbi:MAG: type I glyceraldehyde-3-phosphate dehydrogenase [Candidatus Micrarchaeota archaeon]